jgi:hypothetical protein
MMDSSQPHAAARLGSKEFFAHREKYCHNGGMALAR